MRCLVRTDATDHPKTMGLAVNLGTDITLVDSEVIALGLLVRLWIIPWKYERFDGTLPWDQGTIVRAMGWKGEPGKLIQALLDKKLLDKRGDGYVIHNWTIRQGALVKKLERDRARSENTPAPRPAKPDESPTGSRDEVIRHLMLRLKEAKVPGNSRAREIVVSWIERGNPPDRIEQAIMDPAHRGWSIFDMDRLFSPTNPSKPTGNIPVQDILAAAANRKSAEQTKPRHTGETTRL